jgi:hypothetical protein
MKYQEGITDNLKKAGFNVGWASAIRRNGRTVWIVDAQRGGTRLVVRADEMLTSFLELESVICASLIKVGHHV